MKTLEEFVEKLSTRSFIQATLSKPRPFSPYNNIYIRKVDIKGEEMYQVTYRTDTQDQVENFREDDIKVRVHLWLIQYFFFADLKTKSEDIRLMQSKKGKITITKKSAFNKEKSKEHDRKKKQVQQSLS